MQNKKPDRLGRLEEALYSRNEARLPKGERVHLTSNFDDPELARGLADDVPLADLVSREREHPHRKIFEKVFLFALVFAVFTAGFAGYKFFLGGPSVTEKNINITIGGPSIVSAATPITLDIRVENRNARSIENAVLKIGYPKNSRSIEDKNKALDTETMKIDSLGSGDSIGKQVTFLIYGQKDDIEVLTARLEYQVPGSKATFIKEEVFNLAIGTAPAILDASIPRLLVSKQPFDVVVSVKSNSTETINDLVLTAEYPFGFVYSSSDIKPFTDDNVWHLGDMPAGGSKNVRISGTLEAENNEERTFKFSLAVGGGVFNNSQSQIASILNTVSVSRPFLSLTVGVPGGQVSTQAGDRIPIEITFTNNLSSKLNNGVIKASISGVFDQNNIITQQGGFYNSKDQSIIWQQSGNPDLAEVTPGDTGKVHFTLTVPKLLPTDLKNQGLTVKVLMTADEINGTDTNKITSDASTSFKFKANPNAFAYATRSESVFKQIGTIPPRINKETSYSVNISANTTFANIENASMTATIPPNVSWNNIVSPGNEKIRFDSNTRILSWDIGTVSSSDKGRTAMIQLTITPSSSQLGFSPPLLSRISFSGTDSSSGEAINIDLDDVTTELSHDDGASNNASVVGK